MTNTEEYWLEVHSYEQQWKDLNAAKRRILCLEAENQQLKELVKLLSTLKRPSGESNES